MDYYQEEIKKAENSLEQLKGKSNFFVVVRLLSFIGILLFIFMANSISPYLAILSFLSLVAFIIVAIFHNKHEKRVRVIYNKIIVLKNYQYRKQNNYHTFLNTGVKYLDDDAAYLSDLDLFGVNSLFQYINICETNLGQDKLAKRLKTTDDSYKNDSACVCELKDKLDFSINFQSNNYGYSRDVNKVSLESSLSDLELVPKISNIKDIIIPVLLLINTIIFLILSIVSKNYNLIIFAVIINFAYNMIYSSMRITEFNAIKSISSSLSPLAMNYSLIGSESFDEPKLITLSKSIKNGEQTIFKLLKLETMISLKDNLVSNLILNSFISFNPIVFLKYVKTYKLDNNSLVNSIDSYSEFENLLSLAIIPQIKENTVIPKFNSNSEISFIDIKHPLLIEEDCIANSLAKHPSVNVITGSNMSGKTSFLRTIGINLVLMYAGGMVNAKEFSADAFNIYSSMRITDDIKNGISTFYRELLRIKTAIKDATDGKKCLILVDEVFRGTNSNDRILGAVSLINHLKLPNVILFLTTHDFELCKVDDVYNYHFEEHYIDDKIAFDYKLKNGKCTTTNAVYLMKLVGIINE